MSDLSLETVLKYHKIAQSLTSRSLQIKDKTMLTFLAYCIDCSCEMDQQVVEIAIDTLYLLASTDQNIDQLKVTYGVFEAVEELTLTRQNIPDHLRTKAEQLLNRLQSKETTAPAFCTRSKTKMAQLPQSSKATKLVTLYVHGLNKDCRRHLEQAVIRVRGVVSVVLDLAHQRCFLRVHEALTPVDIATAIFEKTGMEAELISRNKMGQEILKPLLQTSIIDSEDDWPSYLKEEDSPVKEKAITQMFDIKEKTSHWINSAVGFLQKSFYW